MEFTRALKTNPYHDASGRFTSKEKGSMGAAMSRAVERRQGHERMEAQSHAGEHGGNVSKMFGGMLSGGSEDDATIEGGKHGAGGRIIHQDVADTLTDNGYEKDGDEKEGDYGEGSYIQNWKHSKSADRIRVEGTRGESRYDNFVEITRVKEDAKKSELLRRGRNMVAKLDRGIVQKSNPYHDASGAFTSKDKDADGKPSGSSGGGPREAGSLTREQRDAAESRFRSVQNRAVKKPPTSQHRPAVWGGMLGTLYAMNKNREIKYFDYDVERALEHAGIEKAKDIRVAKVTGSERGKAVPNGTGETYGSPSRGKTVYYVKDED